MLMRILWREQRQRPPGGVVFNFIPHGYDLPISPGSVQMLNLPFASLPRKRKLSNALLKHRPLDWFCRNLLIGRLGIRPPSRPIPDY